MTAWSRVLRPPFPKKGLTKSSAKWTATGSILLAMYGSIGKLGIAGTALTTNQAIAHTHPRPLPSRYLFWYLGSVRSELIGLGKGGTQKNISQTVIKTISFPLAPLPEQHRIVAKIESLFVRLEPDTSGLPGLPEGWCWTTVDQLAVQMRNGRSVRTRAGGFPVLRLSAITGGVLDDRDVKEGDWEPDDAEPFRVRPGDFFVSRGNGS